MDVSIKIVNDDGLSEMQMKGVSEVSEAAIIAGFFGQLGMSNHLYPESIKNSSSPIAKGTEKKITTGMVKPVEIRAEAPVKDSQATVEKVLQKSLDDMIDKALQPERSKQLPLVGQERRSAFPLMEVAKVTKVEEPEHWKTGIKVDEDGSKRYKCRYECDCGKKTNIYIELDREYITCHDCGEDLFVEEATDTSDSEGIPNRDGFGNFFVAGLLMKS